MILPHAFTSRFPPSSEALLRAICPMVTDAMLLGIAEADVPWQTKENLRALLPIRDHCLVPAPMQWEPKEVLSLVRWHNPDEELDPDRRLYAHVERMFCCAALMRASVEPGNEDILDGGNSNLIGLVESALAVGECIPETVARFLTWRLPLKLECDSEERPFFAFALLALAAIQFRRSFSTKELEEMVSLVEEAEKIARRDWESSSADREAGSFLDTTFYDLRHQAWRSLAKRLGKQCSESVRIFELAHRIEAE